MDVFNSTISSLAEVVLLDGRNFLFGKPVFTMPALTTQNLIPSTSNFGYTGSDQTFTVPSLITSLNVTLRGAGAGGAGGLVTGTLSVTPGETITLVVGQRGIMGDGGTQYGTRYGGGGGMGNSYGGAGGGMTAIKRGSSLIVVAGGGGGTSYGGGLGGAGGGLTGGDGGNSSGTQPNNYGRGATQLAGGAGGTGTFQNGSAGSTGLGGQAAAYAGGGGGGYFGGGGGAYSGSPYDSAGGGGGGSSYIQNLTGTVTNTQGGGASPFSDGSMSITFNNVSMNFTITGRKFTIKDAYGTLNTKNIVLSTCFNEFFEGNLSSLVLSTNFASLQLFGSSNYWYSLSSNTSGGFNTSTFTINCNAPSFVLDVNSIANISSLNYARIQPSLSNMWLALGNDGTQNNTIKYSYDGINWSNSQGTGFGTAGWSAAFNGNMWVAGGQETNSLRYSYNGLNWLTSPSAFGGGTIIGQNMAWGQNKFVGVGTGTSNILYSSNGINWLSATNVFTAQGYGIAWNGFLWVAVGQDSTQNNTIKYSVDGITWSNSSGTGFTAYGSSVAWNGIMWVATGSDSTQNNKFKYSFDGITWSNSLGTGFTGDGTCVIWNGRMWVATGVDSTANNTIKYSFDGLNWSNSSGSGFTTQGTGVAWNGQMFVATGQDATQNNRIKYSYDGITWSNSSSGAFGNWGNGVAYSSNQTPSYQQTNFAILPQNNPITTFSTNMFLVRPSTITMNNALVLDSMNRNIGIRTFTPDPRFMVDVNGPARGAFYYSTITAGGTFTISPNSNFGVYYNITTNGTYTLSLPASQALSNVGKFFVLRNNTGSSLSITVSGGSGIASPYTLANGTSMTVTVNATNSYTTL